MAAAAGSGEFGLQSAWVQTHLAAYGSEGSVELRCGTLLHPGKSMSVAVKATADLSVDFDSIYLVDLDSIYGWYGQVLLLSRWAKDLAAVSDSTDSVNGSKHVVQPQAWT